MKKAVAKALSVKMSDDVGLNFFALARTFTELVSASSQEQFPRYRSPNQRYVMYQMEAPLQPKGYSYPRHRQPRDFPYKVFKGQSNLKY